MKRQPKYRVWFAIWADDETCVFRLVKTKAAARGLVADLRRAPWSNGVKFGFKRLIEKIETRRRRRAKKERN